jgi:hypothetical protein
MDAGPTMLKAEPHPLDFDWRFDEPTIAKLCTLVRGRSVLAIGAPSIARGIEASGGRVLLVDRQPVQQVHGHLVADALTPDLPEGGFDVAIVDSPWHPLELVEWASAGGRAVGPGGEVLISVWPPETRPGATGDLSEALAKVHDWAEVTVLPVELAYDPPPFELIAVSISDDETLARSPRRGGLVPRKGRSRPSRRCPRGARRY